MLFVNVENNIKHIQFLLDKINTVKKIVKHKNLKKHVWKNIMKEM